MQESTAGLKPSSLCPVGAVRGGKWRIEALLGEGGSGAVYRARESDGAAVALKVLHSELAHEPSVRERFRREAYVANTIGHPGAVRVLQDGVDEDGVPYLVMELLEGENYEDRRVRKGGRLPVNEVLWVADHALAVLAAAHHKGIVHRDIKPENLFLTTGRRLKVLDFGIARLADHGSTTTVGAILGTLAFMPPEQARGASSEVGVRSDLWSVGATMFTLLSGRLVRDDQDVAKLLREAGSTRVPSLGTVVHDLPAEVVELVDNALFLEVRGRWATAKMMRRAVRLTYVKIRRDSERRMGDEEPISEPSFDASVMLPIEPPPASLALGGQRRVVVASRRGLAGGRLRPPQVAWLLLVIVAIFGLAALWALLRA